MSALHELARQAGLSRTWRDASGRDQIVGDEALARILHALGYSASSEPEVRASLAILAEKERVAPSFLSGDVAVPTALPFSLATVGSADLVLEDGRERRLTIEDGVLPAIHEPGYHRLRVLDREIVLAIAPDKCLLPADLLARAGRKPARLWGPAIQIPALWGDDAAPFGSFADLRAAARLFGERGADAVAISPVHALFPGRGDRFSPYSPSSRIAMNAMLADPRLAGLPALAHGGGEPLIDWATEVPARLSALRRLFDALGPEQRGAISAWAGQQGGALKERALFDALALHFAEHGPCWQQWPAEYHQPDSPAVSRFAAQHGGEIEFHLFLQWLADRSLGSVQEAASGTGMAIGLISDLAVGIDPGGSDAWVMQDSVLKGLTIGAPPDPLGPDGQNWGLTSFSPDGLRASAFTPWLATLRAALRHAGGVRIDHAFGLARLWVVPQGAPAAEGAYLKYPFADFLRLIALESHRAGAVVIGEDLGTRPPGFIEPITDKGILGMRVLWFERGEDGRFTSPSNYDEMAVAMTGTHDTATIAGWWTGRDIAWNRRLGRGSGWQDEERQRAQDRVKLWDAIGDGSPAPSPDEPERVVNAAIAYIGKARSELAIVPLEDLLALEEQPNLPGTIDEHPNWRRRLPAPLAQLMADPAAARRIASLVQARTL